MKTAQLNQAHKEILARLIVTGENGINSRYSSLRRKYAQLPARIWELVNEFGFKIDSLPARKRSVQYVLVGVPKAYRSLVEEFKPRYSVFDKAMHLLGIREL